MRARSAAEWAVELEDQRGAMDAIDHGLQELKEALDENWEDSNEVQLLRGMKEALIPKLPTSERADLLERLQQAVASERARQTVTRGVSLPAPPAGSFPAS